MVLPIIKNIGVLSYEPRLAFDTLISEEYLISQRAQNRRVKSMRDKPPCRSIEPGDTVLAGGSYRRVLQRKKDAVIVLGDVGAECLGVGECRREKCLYPAWYPVGRPVAGRQWEMGYVPRSPVFDGKMEAISNRGKWVGEELSKYKNTNLSLVCSALLGCVAGTSGVIFKHRLEACLVQLDAVPSGNPAKSGQMEKIISIFNFTPTRGQLDKLMSPFPPEDKVELVLYSEIMDSVRTMVNGAGKPRFARQCFSLYDHDGRGYIHKEKLQLWKTARYQDTAELRLKGCTPFQVRTLTSIFSKIKKTESDALSKRKPGKNDQIPPFYAIKKHLNLSDFQSYLSTDPQLLAAFLPVCLNMLYTDSISDKEFVQVGTRPKLPPSISRTYSEFFITEGGF